MTPTNWSTGLPGSVGTRLLAVTIFVLLGCVTAIAQVPGGTVFHRMMDDSVYVMQPDGSSQRLLTAGPWTTMSPDGKYLAYWIPERHAVHLFNIAEHSDRVAETIPDAIMQEILFSSDSRYLIYLVYGKTVLPGVRTFEVTSAARNLIRAQCNHVAPDAEPTYLIGNCGGGVERIRLSDGHAERLSATGSFPERAASSPHGAWLGYLVSTSSVPEPADDEPNCLGGTWGMAVNERGANAAASVTVPFPKGFDNVIDFAFSPDDKQVAVTFGVESCDYPGEAAQIYVVSLADLRMKPVTAKERLSVKPKWSPDGKSLVYTDYTDGSLYRVNIAEAKVTRLTDPKGDGPDEVLGWLP